MVMCQMGKKTFRLLLEDHFFNQKTKGSFKGTNS
jgi:hypothetical protein